MVSKTEYKHFEKMHDYIIKNGQTSKEELILESDLSIAWAEKIIKYLPIIYKDIRYDSKHKLFTPLHSTLSELTKESMK